MPFKSKAQERFMFAKHPEIAKEFSNHTKSIKSLPEHQGENKMEHKKAHHAKKEHHKKEEDHKHMHHHHKEMHKHHMSEMKHHEKMMKKHEHHAKKK